MVDATSAILLVSGSLRERSTTAAVLRTAVAVAPRGITAVLFDGVAYLPHFNPDDDRPPFHPAVDAFRQQVRAADAMLFSTPEYAGALPGSFKNALDWMIGDASPRSVYGKRVAWLNSSPRGATGAHDELRRVLGYAGAVIVEAACVHVPVSPNLVDAAGEIADAGARNEIAHALRQLASTT